MENAEEKIMEILHDPEKMEQVMSIARSLGFPPPEEPSSGPPTVPDVPGDERQEALLHALLPYLRPGRREKLERALRLAKLSQFAEQALRNETGQKDR